MSVGVVISIVIGLYIGNCVYQFRRLDRLEKADDAEEARKSDKSVSG